MGRARQRSVAPPHSLDRPCFRYSCNPNCTRSGRRAGRYGEARRHLYCWPCTAVGDVAVLLARDHGELDRLVSILVASDRTSREWQVALDAARLGFAAHADAQQQALAVGRGTTVDRIVEYVLVAHRVQEKLLDRIADPSRPTELVTIDALELKSSLLSHDEQERLMVLPALRDAIPVADYDRLASAYATERLRALGAMWRVVPRHRTNAEHQA